MLVFVKDSRNNLGHPTTKLDMIRRLLSKNRAKIVKKYGKVMLVQLLDKQFNHSQTVDCEFRIGIDPGYTHIGFSMYKIYNLNIIKILSGEVLTRTSEITKNLTERRMYRNQRRRNRRKAVLRKYGRAKFRKPIWKNRVTHKFQPTHIHLIDTHLNLVNKLLNLVPQDQAKIHIEYCTFDIHKIIKPWIKSWMYQNGDQAGYENIKSYIRHRDNYQCQLCKKFVSNTKNEVHHIIHRSKGGSDRPDNLILLCPKCHAKVHAKNIKLSVSKSNNNYCDSGVLNSCMKELYFRLESICPVQHTYGYITKHIRQFNNLEKTHAIDASLISLSDCHDMQDISEYSYTDHELSINFKQYRRHVRNFAHAYQDKKYYLGKKVIGYNKNKRSGQTKDSLVEAKRKYPNQDIISKPGRIVYRRNNKDIKFRPGDGILYNGNMHTCQGWASTQYKVILHNLGKVKQKLCNKLYNNQGMCWVNYIQS